MATYKPHDPLVARSQGLSFIDLLQDVNALRMAFGGGSANDRAWTFLQQHASTFLFNTASLDTAEWASKLIGQERQMLFSGGGGQQHRQGNASLLDDWLGVNSDVHWSEAWAPVIRACYELHSNSGAALRSMRRLKAH